MSDYPDSAATGQELPYEELRRFSSHIATCLKVMERLTRRVIKVSDYNCYDADSHPGYYNPSAAEKLVLHNFDELAQNLVEACPFGAGFFAESCGLNRIVVLAGIEKADGYLTWHENAEHLVERFFRELVEAGDYERSLNAVNFFHVCSNGYDIAAARDIIQKNVGAVCEWLSDQQHVNPMDYLFDMDVELALFKAANPEGDARELAEPVRQYRGLDDRQQVRTPDNIFRLDNDTWTIRFNGGELQKGIKNSMPARDICFLLANAGKIKSIYDLPDNRGLKPQTHSTPVATKQDYKILREQIQACHNVLENDQDPETQDEVKKALDDLRKQQNENFDKDGNPRQLASDTAKAVRSTKVRINRFYDGNSERMSDLVAHLRQSLEIDEKCLYSPDKMNWDCGEML